MTDRTEAPTPRRLEQARREGNVCVSSGLLHAAALVVALALVPAVMGIVAGHAAALYRFTLARAGKPGYAMDPSWVLVEATALALPMLLAVAVTVVAVGAVQSGGAFAIRKVKPDLKRLSAEALRKSLFAPTRLFGVVRAAVTVSVIAWIVVSRLQDHIGDFGRCAGRLHQAMKVARQVTWTAARDVVVVLLLLGICDFLVARRAWWSQLKMSRQQVLRDHKEAQGDPQQRSARQQAHQEVLQAAALRAVRDATVVVVNPVRLANALYYDLDRDDAPVLVAQGQGEFAARIVEQAHAWGVPVVQDIPVAQALAELSQGDAIPPGLYEAVAEIVHDVLDQST